MMRALLIFSFLLCICSCATQSIKPEPRDLVWTAGSQPYDAFQKNKARWESKSAGSEYWYITSRSNPNNYYSFGLRLVKVVDDKVVELYLQRESFERLTEAGFFERSTNSAREYFLQSQNSILTIDELFFEINNSNSYIDKNMKLILAKEIAWEGRNYSSHQEEARLAIREDYQQSNVSRSEFVSRYFSNKNYEENLGYPTRYSRGCPFDLILHCISSVSISDVKLGEIEVVEDYGPEWIRWQTWLKNESVNMSKNDNIN